MQPELLLDSRTELGEGPVWDSRLGVLYWVDIYAGTLHIYNPQDGDDHTIHIGEPLGCAAPRRTGGLILGLGSGFGTLDLSDGSWTHLTIPQLNLHGNRFNDGKCDPVGRFIAGTMDDTEKSASGSLYSLDPDFTLRTLITGLHISNGLTWSPDNRTFYFIDTPTRFVMAYDYDLAIGRIANPRPVVSIPPDLGWPDGMTSDIEGMLWVALWGGARITRWDPATGQMVAEFSIPALNVTSCIFGGSNLTDLFITTARKGLTTSELAEYPLSGGLFRLKTNIRGMPTSEYGG